MDILISYGNVIVATNDKDNYYFIRYREQGLL